nr:MAG TPA: hypothetical protein [Caudoviricetes sp.]
MFIILTKPCSLYCGQGYFFVIIDILKGRKKQKVLLKKAPFLFRICSVFRECSVKFTL